MSFTIRECTPADFPGVFSLLQQLWPDKKLVYSDLERVYNQALSSAQQRLILGVNGSKVVGFCSLTINNNLWLAGNLGHVDELVVDNDFRGHGLGKQLMDAIIEIARKNTCKRIELDSAFHREEAHRFYTNIGFENRAYLFSKQLS